MFRAVLSVFAGYFSMAVLVIVAQTVVERAMGPIDPDALPKAYLAVNLSCSVVFAVVGGWVAVAIARRTLAATSLALLILVMGLASLLAFRGSQPGWYSALLPALAAAGAWAGGWLKSRRQPSTR
jgi:hypothetical protein